MHACVCVSALAVVHAIAAKSESCRPPVRLSPLAACLSGSAAVMLLSPAMVRCCRQLWCGVVLHSLQHYRSRLCGAIFLAGVAFPGWLLPHGVPCPVVAMPCQLAACSLCADASVHLCYCGVAVARGCDTSVSALLYSVVGLPPSSLLWGPLRHATAKNAAPPRGVALTRSAVCTAWHCAVVVAAERDATLETRVCVVGLLVLNKSTSIRYYMLSCLGILMGFL